MHGEGGIYEPGLGLVAARGLVEDFKSRDLGAIHRCPADGPGGTERRRRYGVVSVLGGVVKGTSVNDRISEAYRIVARPHFGSLPWRFGHTDQR